MSLRDFWMNVRTAARVVAPNVAADSPIIDSQDIEHHLRQATIWLTPRSVEGFDPMDFNFLPPDEVQALADSVTRFREIARRVPSDGGAPEEQVQQALPEFQRILELIRPDKYADPDALIIGKQIEKRLAGQLSDSVAEIRFETGEDSNGGAALWIWVVLKDAAAEEPMLHSNARIAREVLRNAASELGIERWPYVRFRSVSELARPAEKSTK